MENKIEKKMEERTGYYRPDLEPFVCYVQGESIYFGPETRSVHVSHALDDSPVPPCVRGNLTVLGWRLVYTAREYLARSPLAENSLAFEEFMMKQIINDMASVASGTSPMRLLFQINSMPNQ